jgi:uncharacterized membrane protein YhaH (DUF805 family)
LMLIGVLLSAASPDSAVVGGVLAAIGGIAALGLAITLIVFMFLEGTRGPNRFGPDPKGSPLDEVFA